MVWLINRVTERRSLVADLENAGIVRSRHVKAAMLAVPRELFVSEDLQDRAYLDSPLPLGNSGQTISAPHMVALMLQELELHEGHSVLEIGLGSGYNAACMAVMVGKRGKVISLEVRSELVKSAIKSLEAAGLSDRVQVEVSDGTSGWPKSSREERYDRVVLTAAARDVPQTLFSQLRTGGILLAPLGGPYVQELTKFKKKRVGEISHQFVCDCVFVPLVEGERVSI